MELNKLDWNEMYNQHKLKLARNPTEANLYLQVEQVLEKLNDNHAYIEATDEVYDAIDALALPEEEINENSLPELGDLQVAGAGV